LYQIHNTTDFQSHVYRELCQDIDEQVQKRGKYVRHIAEQGDEPEFACYVLATLVFSFMVGYLVKQGLHAVLRFYDKHSTAFSVVTGADAAGDIVNLASNIAAMKSGIVTSETIDGAGKGAVNGLSKGYLLYQDPLMAKLFYMFSKFGAQLIPVAVVLLGIVQNLNPFAMISVIAKCIQIVFNKYREIRFFVYHV
jgi:hypothetical protein